MNQLNELIRAFQARVKLAISLFQTHRGLKDVLDWLRESLSRTGYIDDTQTLAYSFHGAGCRAETPEGPIDWDFSKWGRIDGVDLWRLNKFLGENPQMGEVFPEQHRLTEVFELAIVQGVLVQDPDDPLSPLFVLQVQLL
jgi:hypothetical protein